MGNIQSNGLAENYVRLSAPISHNSPIFPPSTNLTESYWAQNYRNRTCASTFAGAVATTNLSSALNNPLLTSYHRHRVRLQCYPHLEHNYHTVMHRSFVCHILSLCVRAQETYPASNKPYLPGVWLYPIMEQCCAG